MVMAQTGQPPLADTKAPQAAVNDFVRCDGCYAFLASNGTLLRRKPFDGVTSARIGVGNYEVRFPLRIEGCAWLGTIGNADFFTTTPAGLIAVTGRIATDDGLFVQTWNAAGTTVDFPSASESIADMQKSRRLRGAVESDPFA